MTLIAFSTGPDSADIVTDTWAYSSTGREFSYTTKTHPLLHANSAVVFHGSQAFGKHMLAALLTAPGHATSLDDLRQTIDLQAAAVRSASLAEGEFGDLGTADLFLIGYSPARTRFEAYHYARLDSWHEVPIEGLFVTPTPFGIRPRNTELAHYVEFMHDEDRWGANLTAARASCDADYAVLTSWPEQHTVTAPDTAERWAGLAERVREDRAKARPGTGLRVPVGGDLHLTRLTVGAAIQQPIWQFDDTPEGLVQVSPGTLNDLGLSLPCPCGSGRTHIECCVAANLTNPCPCQSGLTLAACCLARPEVSPLRAVA